MLTTFPPVTVLKPVSAIKMSPVVVSTTPGRFPERIWLLPMLNVAFPAAAIWPNTSAVLRNMLPLVIAIAGVVGTVGQNVPLRPCSVPPLITTGMPVPLLTIRKFTLSKMTPEPLPELAMLSALSVPSAYATLLLTYNCCDNDPLKMIALLPLGAYTSMPLIATTPPLVKDTCPLIAVAKPLPATVA